MITRFTFIGLTLTQIAVLCRFYKTPRAIADAAQDLRTGMFLVRSAQQRRDSH